MATDQAVKTAARGMPMAEYRGEFAPGRPFTVSVPADLSPTEALALVEKVGGLPRELAARRGHHIIVPGPAV